MANLNLSQFTTKTLVEDADWVFVWDTAGAISKKVSRNSLLNSGTLLTSAPVTISQTWNDAAVAFTALKVNATSTNSAAASLLLDLQVGGVGQFAVNKTGKVFFGGSSVTFIEGITNTQINLGNTVGGLFSVNYPSGASVPDTYFYGWSSTGDSKGAVDTKLFRDSASGNTLALRNSTAAQTFNVYGTYTSASAYARLAIACDTSGNATLTTQSTGVAGTVSIGNSNKIIIGAPNNVALAFNATDATSTGFRTASSNTLELVRSDAASYANLTVNNLTLQGALIASNFPLSSNSNIAGTNVEAASFIVSTTSNNTTAAGFGTRLLYKTETDTNALQDSGAISSVWSNAVNATRTSDMLFYNVLNGTLTERMRILGTTGNVGIGTTAPSSKLHVEGASSPTILIKNTSASGYSQFLFGNTVVTGDGMWLNGSTQTGFGGASSLNVFASSGPIAFHTTTVTNALSIAQNGTAVFGGSVFAGSSLFTGSGVGTGVYHPTNGGIAFTGSGVVTVYGGNSYTTFDKFQIGGSTSAFPTLKRVGTELQVVIASTTATINVAAPDADMTFIEDRYRRKGAGSPEGVVTAPIGAVYHNTTGGAGTSFYVKESGTGNTGWVGK